jgi:hypothetical protein
MRAYKAQIPEQIHIEPSTETSQDATNGSHRRTYYGFKEDDDAVAAIRDKFKFSNDSDAVRLALRLVAASDIQVKITPVAARRIVIKLKSPTTG